MPAALLLALLAVNPPGGELNADSPAAAWAERLGIWNGRGALDAVERLGPAARAAGPALIALRDRGEWNSYSAPRWRRAARAVGSDLLPAILAAVTGDDRRAGVAAWRALGAVVAGPPGDPLSANPTAADPALAGAVLAAAGLDPWEPPADPAGWRRRAGDFSMWLLAVERSPAHPVAGAAAELLAHPDTNVRRAAVRALTDAAPDRGGDLAPLLPTLRRLALDDPDAHVRRAAAERLAEHGETDGKTAGRGRTDAEELAERLPRLDGTLFPGPYELHAWSSNAARVARLAPGHAALPGAVFPRIPAPPPDLPTAAPPRGTAAWNRWDDGWDEVERRLSAVCRPLAAMGPHAAPVLPRLVPHLTRCRNGVPLRELLLVVAALGPLPDAALASAARRTDDIPWRTVPFTHPVLLDAGARAVPHVAAALAEAAPPVGPVEAYGLKLRADLTPREAENALRGLTRDRAEALRSRLWLLSRFPPDDLAPHRAAVAGALAPLCGQPDLTVRRWAVAVLGRIPADPRGAPPRRAAVPLLSAAADADPRVRAEAVRGLGRRAFAADARPVLAAALTDEFATVRLPAVRAWRAAGFEEAALEPLRDDPNPAVRLAAGGMTRDE